jgi:ribonuclease/clavin/mitogillin
MLSLKTLLALKPGVLYPAHGPHIPGHEAAHAHIQNYITHRQDRENQIIEVLKTASKDPNYITTTLQTLITKFEKDALDHENYKEEFMTQVHARDGGLTPAQKKAKDEAKTKAMKGLEVDGGVRVVGLDNIARMIYKTRDEKIVFAAKKSLTAHLEKLIREGKVKMGRGVNPVILDGKVGEAKEVEGYELSEESAAKGEGKYDA